MINEHLSGNMRMGQTGTLIMGQTGTLSGAVVQSFKQYHRRTSYMSTMGYNFRSSAEIVHEVKSLMY